MNEALKKTAGWIWLEKGQTEANQYGEFRREFELTDQNMQDTVLYISADSDYVVWLNGKFVACGQHPDYPDKRSYDTIKLDQQLKAGRNALCILLYYQGESTSTYLRGDAGLFYVLEGQEFFLVSDQKTRCRRSSSYQNGPLAKITSQLTFVYQYDARKQDDWLVPSYQMDNSWQPALINPQATAAVQQYLQPRPVEKLLVKDRLAARLVAQGQFWRQAKPAGSVAELMQKDFLSPLLQEELFATSFAGAFPCPNGAELIFRQQDPQMGIYLVLDLGRIEAGLFEIELTAGAGTIIDIAYGEHLDDLRVRSHVGGRNFANRYICQAGRQVFTHYTSRLAGRYLQLHISQLREKTVFYYAGLRPTDYPVTEKGKFFVQDRLWQKIYAVGVRTLHLCMHEHYEDTPWREQALYSMDSRNQALCGYYCFADYEFARASFQLLGDGLDEDGFLELCAPASIPITIPSFSLAWILELADHYLYSGDGAAAASFWPKVEFMLDSYLARLVDGLLPSPCGPRYWHFYEWSEGMDDSGIFSGTSLTSQRFDAPLNAFFILALEAGAQLARAVGQKRQADQYSIQAQKVKAAAANIFWDSRAEAYLTYQGAGAKPHFAELTQALCLMAGLVDQERQQLVRARLAKADNKLVPATLSHCLYKFTALLEDPDYAQIVFKMIEKDWGYMLFSGASSFWETIKGGADFARAGSLSHGWSAIPVYFYYAYILGIKPIEPGFKTFTFDPATTVVAQASGRVPTPVGDIEISWDMDDNGLAFELEYPQSIQLYLPEMQEG